MEGKVGQRWRWKYENESDLLVEITELNTDKVVVKILQIFHSHIGDKVGNYMDIGHLTFTDTDMSHKWEYLEGQDKPL